MRCVFMDIFCVDDSEVRGFFGEERGGIAFDGRDKCSVMPCECLICLLRVSLSQDGNEESIIIMNIVLFVLFKSQFMYKT